MSEPLRIACPSTTEIPSSKELARAVTPLRHVVLELEADPDPEQLQALAAALQRQHPRLSVFCSGRSSLTLKHVVSDEELTEQREALAQAVIEFISQARALVGVLASELDTPACKVDEHLRFRLDEAATHGTVELEGEPWTYSFHGYECRFRSQRRGSVLEVRLEDWGEDEALLDPYFVGEYLHTTPGLEPLAALLPDRFHDTRRALQILAADPPWSR